ncbi:monocarboxylate transporter [Scheffersomyces xylosifermentans]|uniref:monocarboxylate transporter n=1 Tax=Scheffersomyces xylosifermentans TaxID=1304137 RepID=UPI00315CF91E
MFRSGTSDTDSHKSDDATVAPYAVNLINTIASNSCGSSILRTKTNQSELSRIISAIKDDRQQDDQEYENYKDRNQPESILINQLDLVSRHTSRNDLESNIIVGGEKDKVDEQEETLLDDGPPLDGGFAWVIAICAMLSVFATWGANAGYGVFLNFYLDSNSFPGATQYDFALIGGLVVFFAQFLAPISAFAYKIFGFKAVSIVGIVVQTAGYILSSFATQIWQLYLTQGVMVGVSFSLIFLPATLVLPTWFDKRRATAMGICVAGAGLGGLIFSLSVNRVIQQTGDQRWALRMCGLVALAASAFSTILMKPRNYKALPFSQTLKKDFLVENIKIIFDMTVFKNYALVALAVWFALALLGYTLMLFSLASYANSVGLSHQQGSDLTAILNAAQIVGRPLMGMSADYIGRTNMTTTFSFLISILIYAFWINAKTYGALIGLSVVLGLIVGVGSSMAQPVASDILDETPAMLPAAWSGMNIFVSFFCLVAEVIALSLVKKGPSPYLHTQIFAGSCFFACFIVMLVIREWFIRRTLKRRLAATQSRISKKQRREKGYLTTDALEPTEDPESLEILQERVERYDKLLRPSPLAFVLRTVYPIRV